VARVGRGGHRPPYAEAVHLGWVAIAHWDLIDGELAARGIDPLDLPYGRFLNLVYVWAVQRIGDPLEIEKFDASLLTPVASQPRTRTEEQAVVEDEMRAFMAAGPD
jgi:hypothetical protein